MRVVAAVDKYKGSVTAAQVAAAIGHACWELGHDCVEVPVADGGDGTLDALGGPNRTSTVTGPLGDPVQAEWRMHRTTAIIEMARASGLALVGGRETQRRARRVDGGHGRADRPGARRRREEDHRVPRRLGHHRRRPRRGAGDPRAASPARREPARGVRRHHSLRRRSAGVRPAEGRVAGAGAHVERTARPPGAGVPRRVRRRRERHRGRRRSRRARRCAGRARRQARARLRSRGRRDRPVRHARRPPIS